MGGISFSYEERFMAAGKTPPSVIGQVRGIMPKLGELTDKVVFGDVWERPGLSKRDRSLVTVAALTALYRPDQIRGHIWRALDNGVTREEIVELITHLAIYAGWPNAGTAALIAKQVFQERGA
jgi:4-carboxymuconolactone decarboxylase